MMLGNTDSVGTIGAVRKPAATQGPSLPDASRQVQVQVQLPQTHSGILPFELWDLINGHSLDKDRRTPWNLPAPALERVDDGMWSFNCQAASASRAVRALVGAPDGAAFLEALDGLDNIAPHYRGRCRDAAWDTMQRTGHRLPGFERDAILLRLLAGLDAEPGRCTRRLRQAMGLLERSHDRPSRALVTALVLRSGAADPEGSPVWPEMLSQRVRHTRTRQSPEWRLLDGLPAARTAELRLMFRCAEHPPVADPAAMAPLLQDIRAVAAPALRLAMLQALARTWPDLARPAQDVARRALREALLGLDGAQLEEALRCLPADGPPEAEVALLLERSRPLAPTAALRVLTAHAGKFMEPVGSRRALEQRCIALDARSRVDAANHPAFVEQFAILSRAVTDVELLRRLTMRIRHDCGQLPVHRRAAILARLIPQPGSGQRNAGHHWAATLRAARREIGNATRESAWQHLCAILPGLRSPYGCEAVWEDLHPTLSTLTGDDRADALEAVAGEVARAVGPCPDAEARRLLDHCRGLPMHLRVLPLQAVIALGTKLSDEAAAAFRAELKRTRRALTARLDP